MRRIATPARPGEKQLQDIRLEKEGGVLQLRFRLMDGSAFLMPLSDETARELGRALLSATDRILIAS